MERPIASRLFDPAKVKETLRLIRADDQIVELRVLEATKTSNSWPATHSGYFDDPEKLVTTLHRSARRPGFTSPSIPSKPRCWLARTTACAKRPKGAVPTTPTLRRGAGC